MIEAKTQFPLESLLSARQLLAPQIHYDTIYFMSNISGMYSLYKMKREGSIPVPLLPEGLALQNPHLINGKNFDLLPKLNKIVVMIDRNGDELYQPCFIPLDGGIPEPIFNEKFIGMQVIYYYGDPKNNIAYLGIDTRQEPGYELLSVNLESRETKSYGKTPYGKFFMGISDDHSKIIFGEGYGPADTCVYYQDNALSDERVLIGTPISKRETGVNYQKTGIDNLCFVEDDKVVVFASILDSDLGSLNWKYVEEPNNTQKLEIRGLDIDGSELEVFNQIVKDQFYLQYNVNGETYYYLAQYRNENGLRFIQITDKLIGNREGPLNNGVKLSISYDILKAEELGYADEFVVAYTKATMPSQLYEIKIDTLSEQRNIEYLQLSDERILGIPKEYLSQGEESTYTSFDGLSIASRLYLPSPNLNISTPYPLVLWIHGGPQSQEVPDFTWFSMPLIQYLTLNGFAVSVPNVRGSTGYGTEYMAKVENDWGGADLKDHLEGLKYLEQDNRIDSSNRFVAGRSYGGFMTLSLISRHPDLWKGGVDMFGPYDLIGFYNRLPPSWQTYFDLTLANPKTENGQKFMKERSPKSYFSNISAPLLVIQGANDPRIKLEESQEIVEQLRKEGKKAEILVFEDEGHDVIKFKNKVICYNRIVKFFKENIS